MGFGLRSWQVSLGAQDLGMEFSVAGELRVWE